MAPLSDPGEGVAGTTTLVTGSSGLVGSHVCADIRDRGGVVVGYDIACSLDVLDFDNLLVTARNCQSIVHCAALLGSPDQRPEDILAVNLHGTLNVLAAALAAGMSRVVFVSSASALGVFKGARQPDYLPLDDAHDHYPASIYDVSKLLAEELCELFCRTTDLAVICLRPPAVWSHDTYIRIHSERTKRPEFEWHPYWEYGAFIDVRDLSMACIKALACPVEGFERLLVSASDISTSGRSSRQLASLMHPNVPWRGGDRYEDDEFHSLIDSSAARRILSWTPLHTWQDFLRSRQATSESA